MIEREQGGCVGDVNVLIGVTGVEMSYHYILDVKVQIGCGWKAESEKGR